MIIINGAAGWMGRSAIRALKELDQKFCEQEILFLGSRKRNLNDPTLGLIEIESLFEQEAIHGKCDLFIQLAFKTRDYQHTMSSGEYEKANIKIIEKSLALASETAASNIVLVSSGAVGQSEDSTDVSDPYARLKHYEESEFGRISKELDANICIGRLWGATGELMTEPLKYAIGDIIKQTIQSEEVKLTSTNYTYRRYVDSVEFMKVIIQSAKFALTEKVDSGGPLIEMYELAESIGRLLGINKPIKRNFDSNKMPDMYFSRSTQYEALSSHLSQPISSLTTQIKRTSNCISGLPL